MSKTKAKPKKSKKPTKKAKSKHSPASERVPGLESLAIYPGADRDPLFVLTPALLKEADEVVKEMIKNQETKKKPWWKFWA